MMAYAALLLSLGVTLAVGDLTNSTSRLFSALEQGHYDELLGVLHEGVDVAQADTGGRLPLVFAAPQPNAFAHVLLLTGASVNDREPSTGMTAMHAAVEARNYEVARTLLSFGAKPELRDSLDRSAKDLAAGDTDLGLMLALFEDDGPAAFEDPPGTWLAHADPNTGAEYFYNAQGEVAHFRPPSLSWTTHVVQGHRAYQNSVTHQETWKLPDALAWRRIDTSDRSRHYWYNFRTGTTTHQQPAELLGETLHEALAESRAYWRHAATGATAWEHPEPHPWRIVKHEDTNYNYYYHSETGDAVWHPPDEFAWKQTLSTEHERHYWFNRKTGEASWDAPAHFAWHRHELGAFVASPGMEL